LFFISCIPKISRFFRLNKKIGLVWLVIALIVSISRLYLGAHYLSDVIAGALIGYGIGVLVIWVYNKYFK